MSMHVHSAQQQKGSSDCGVFAKAFALHAALGQDVLDLEFNHLKMRSTSQSVSAQRHFHTFQNGLIIFYFLGREIEMFHLMHISPCLLKFQAFGSCRTSQFLKNVLDLHK